MRLPFPALNRREIGLAAVLAAIAVFQVLTLQQGHGWGDDFAMYISHSRNLVEGRPYAETGYIYNPEEPIGPPRAPPGFPFLLAPIYATRGADLPAMKLLIVATFVAALAVLALLIGRWESAGTALAVTALVGFHPFFSDFKNNVLSDLPFLCFLLLALWLFERARVPPANRTAILRAGITLGAALWAAYSIRPIGVLLPAAIIVTELLERRRLRSSTMLGIGVFASLAFAQSVLLQGPSDYLAQLSFHAGLVKSNVVEYARDLQGLFDTGFSTRAAMAVFAIANLLALAGMVRSLIKRTWLPVIFSLLYFGSALLWPYPAGVRYLIPVIPFYFFFVVAGLQLLTRRFVRARHFIIASAAGLVLVTYGARYYSLITVPQPPGIDSPDAQSLFHFVRSGTPGNAVIVFKKPRALALYTGRKAAIYSTRARDPWKFIRKIGATHIAVIRRSAQDSSYVAQLETKIPHSLMRVFENKEFTVFKIVYPRIADVGEPPMGAAVGQSRPRTTVSTSST
jgi:hypothetical protein